MAQIEVIKLITLLVLLEIVIGGAFPFVFSAFILGAVNQVSAILIGEVRRVLEIKTPSNSGKAPRVQNIPIYDEFNNLIEMESLHRVLIPGLGAIILPVVVWAIGGKVMLGGFLIGVFISGTMLALMMSNAGGSWDNAKKHIEAGAYGGKGSAAHEASVISDTVGDPLKDAVAPSMDILMKLIAILAIVLAGA